MNIHVAGGPKRPREYRRKMWVRANRVLGIALPFVEDRAEGVERSANIHFIGGHVVDRFGRKNIGERIIESVFAVPKCNSKTVIPRIKAQTARRERCTEHDARNWKTPEPSKWPQSATARLRPQRNQSTDCAQRELPLTAK